MAISLKNWIRNKLHEIEEMHDYSVSTDTVRCWIDEWETEILNSVNLAVTIGSGHLTESLQFEEIHRFVKDQKNVVIISGHNLPPANILAEIVQGVKEKHPEFFNTDKAFSEPMSLLTARPEITEINYQITEKKKGHERPYKFHR